MSPDPMTPDTEIFEHAPVGLIYSENRVIRRCNLRFAAMFGYGAGSLEGQSLEMLYPSRDEFDTTGQHWVRELRAHGAYADERVMRRQDGTLFWCRVRGQALDADDPLARAVWSFSDLSVNGRWCR
jgi:PAS domain S-box-containing protein